MQQDQADQAYDYILKKITESDILEKTDVNHLISELEEKYSIFKELAFVLIVRAWHSSDCHVRLVNIPKFSPSEQVNGKTDILDQQPENLATNSIESTYTINGKKVLQDQGEEPSDDFYEVVKKSQKTTISAKTPGLLKRYKFCGKRNCRCREKGQKHGPYYYQNIRDPKTGKQKQIYIGRAPR